jgi:hypothetical protein
MKRKLDAYMYVLCDKDKPTVKRYIMLMILYIKSFLYILY